MLDQALLQLALTLTLNLSDDPCTPIQPITITYNAEHYEKFPGNQGGRVLQVVEAHTLDTRYVLILSDEATVLSFLSRTSTDTWRSEPWKKGQVAGTLHALQSDNDFQLIRPAYCDLPVYNPMMYETYSE